MTSWTIWSMGFSRPDYWSRSHFPSPRDLPKPGTEPRSPALKADSLPAEPQGSPSILEWVVYHFCRGSSQPRNQTGDSCIAEFFTNWAIREACKTLKSENRNFKRKIPGNSKYNTSNCKISKKTWWDKIFWLWFKQIFLNYNTKSMVNLKAITINLTYQKHFAFWKMISSTLSVRIKLQATDGEKKFANHISGKDLHLDCSVSKFNKVTI